MPRIVALVSLSLAATLALGSAEDDAYYTLRIGDTRPALDVRVQDGGTLDWAQLEGRVAVIDFWASWCAPCIAAFPKFNELEERFSDRPVEFLSVTYEPESKVRSLLAERPLNTRLGFDNDFATFKSFRAWGIPVTYIFDPKGTLVSAIHPEYLTAELLEEVLAGEIPDVEQTRGWPDPEGAEEHFRSLLAGDAEE